MDSVIGVVGFIIGIILFLLALENFQMIFIGFKSIIGLFLLCWVFGMILAWIAWRIAIVVGVIALIAWILSKIFKKETPSATKDETETDNHTK